jgi:hypothetical protein
VHTEVRFTLILVVVTLAAVPAWLAGRIIAANVTVLSWKRAQGVVVWIGGDHHVEVEIRGEPDPPRISVPIDHTVGLSFLKKVPLYVDPADPRHLRIGGLFQMWLWPTGLVCAALVLLSVAAAAATIGRDHPDPLRESTGRWMFSPPPPPLQTEIRVYRPASEWQAPLFWSLLGVAALASAAFTRSAGQIPRMGLGSVGMLFMLLMWALALDNKTTEIAADQNGMRKSTVFGWCQIRWEQVGSVEKQHTIFGRSERTLRQGSSSSFPGRDVTTVVFADRNGRRLLSMSPAMQPSRAVRQLLDTCAGKTGLHMEFRTIYDPNL